jgi:uncharacterized membrane protein YcaP (DUF421 family)
MQVPLFFADYIKRDAMKKEEIHLGDIQRILFGDAPPEFLLEVFVRAVIMYIILVTIVRLLGKRTNAQLTISERSVFITLGAMVAMPMQVPTSGIVIGMITLFCILFFQRMLTLSFFNNPRWENLLQGETKLLIKDSIIDMKALDKANLSRGQLFEMLRNKKIKQLGQLKRVYWEACGKFSIFKNEEPKPGLGILPDDMPKQKDESLVCSTCGNGADGNLSFSCSNCDNQEWVNALKEEV